jgi:hypothetical protein
MLNIFSLVILFLPYIVDNEYFFFTIFINLIAITIIYWSLTIIYNQKRQDRIVEKYKNESRKSRQLGVFKVVLYEVLSFAFLIFSVSMIKK